MEDLYLLPNTEEEVIDSYDEDIMVTNREGIILKASHISGSKYGLKAGELIGQSVYDLEEKGIFSPAITPLVRRQKKKVVLVQKDRNGGKLLITGIPLFNDKQEVEFVISYSYDVSELLILQEHLDEMQLEMDRVKEELETLRERNLQVEGMIAESKSMKLVLEAAAKAASSDAPVFLQGENGTGKTTLAKLIHKQSEYRHGPFIEVHCASIPDWMLEKELMGSNEQGQEKAGYFQLAAGGTLYLNGIDELSGTAQSILYQSLRKSKSKFRIISSSESDLESLAETKSFRDDLFYAIYVVPIRLKPLRERPEDLSRYILHLLERDTSKKKGRRRLSDGLFREMLALEWKGNHQEVENVVERMLAENDSETIPLDALPANYRRKDNDREGEEWEGQKLPAILEEVEGKVLQQARRKFGTTTEMARALGISQPSIVRKMKKYGIQ